MNGKELLERGIRRGIPLWRIEAELDWRENQGPRWVKDDVPKRRGPGVCRWVRLFPRQRDGFFAATTAKDPPYCLCLVAAYNEGVGRVAAQWIATFQ
jgi:hypothetical protein